MSDHRYIFPSVDGNEPGHCGMGGHLNSDGPKGTAGLLQFGANEVPVEGNDELP